MHREVFERLLNRPADSHKYNFGHVLIIGGSPGMVGAPFLAARAALRVGAGLVTIASSAEVIDKLEKRVEEIMTMAFSKESELEDFIRDRKVTVIVIGPGMKPGAVPLKLIKEAKIPTIVDGGALTALAGNSSHFPFARGTLAKTLAKVLTPHPGEFQRFFEEPLPKSRSELRPIAQKFAQDHKLILVLKGEPTYVAQPDGQIYENPSGGPELATAGSGDVLSGIVAGIISQGIELDKAVEAAVYLHGLAGELAAKQKTQPGVIASDIISSIPAALKYQRV